MRGGEDRRCVEEEEEERRIEERGRKGHGGRKEREAKRGEGMWRM